MTLFEVAFFSFCHGIEIGLLWWLVKDRIDRG